MTNLALGHDSANATVDLTNDIDLDGAIRTVQVGDGAAAVDGRLSGVLSGDASSGLTVDGGGTLDLTGDNTYGGATTVSGNSTLLANNSTGSATGTGSVTVDTGSTLGGDGAISGLAFVNGTIAPGNSIGSLSVGELLIGGSGQAAFEIGAQGGSPDHDSIVVSTDVTLLSGADLGLTQDSSFAGLGIGDLFFLVENQGGSAISGTFASLNGVVTDLSQGQTFTFSGYDWSISYEADIAGDAFTGGDDLALQVAAIPEPQTFAFLAGLLGIAFAVFHNRKR